MPYTRQEVLSPGVEYIVGFSTALSPYPRDIMGGSKGRDNNTSSNGFSSLTFCRIASTNRDLAILASRSRALSIKVGSAFIMPWLNVNVVLKFLLFVTSHSFRLTMTRSTICIDVHKMIFWNRRISQMSLKICLIWWWIRHLFVLAETDWLLLFILIWLYYYLHDVYDVWYVC